jgi:tRNA pseudouridine55 synthase
VSAPALDGVLVVDKSRGPTSHDVVARARRVLRTPRVGHLGTLDPMATGVLPLVVGRATRLAPYFPAENKVYEATVAFGRATDTYDAEGTTTGETGRQPSRAALEAALAPLRGTFLQQPPAYSAKKIGGVAAHTLARREAPVVLAPVAVTVDRLDLLDYTGGAARLRLAVRAGFYVRSLAHDLGVSLGTGAHLAALRRLESAGFRLEGAVTWEELVTGSPEALAARVVPVDALLPELPAVTLAPAHVAWVRHGRDVPGGPGVASAVPYRLVDGDGRLVALARPAAQPGLLHPVLVVG